MTDQDQSTLPVTQQDDFVADILEKNEMDLSKLKGLQYIVAINTGSRNKCKLLASSIHGPFDFYEMVEQVGYMYATEQHHAKVTVLEKDTEKPTIFLDAGTTDFIEAHWQDIITEEILEAACVSDYTCEAGFVQEEPDEKPDTEEDEESFL